METVLHLVDRNELVVLPPLGNFWPPQLGMAVDRAELETVIVELDRDRLPDILVELIGTACLQRQGNERKYPEHNGNLHDRADSPANAPDRDHEHHQDYAADQQQLDDAPRSTKMSNIASA